MRSKLISKLDVIGFVIATLVVSGCKQHEYNSDGSFIDLRLIGANSSDEIESKFRKVMADRYEDPTNGFSIYPISNRNSHFLFLQVYNYPRGLAVFSLYCYEQTKPAEWRLRVFVPVNECYFTNGSSKVLRFNVIDREVDVIYRGQTILTVM